MNPLKTFASALIFVAAASTGLFAAGPVATESNGSPVYNSQPLSPETNKVIVPKATPAEPKKEEAKPAAQKTERKKIKFSIKDGIKTEQATMDGGGIYISVGALLIILILLIIFA